MIRRIVAVAVLSLVAQLLLACGSPATPGETAAPTPSAALSVTDLKYELLREFPNHFYCDPDYYPVARGDEQELALQAFPALQADRQEFESILSHNGLAGLDTFTDEQKLLIYQEHKRLAAVGLEPAGDGYRFELQTQDTEGQGELIHGLIDRSGTITVEQREPNNPTCPRCLAAGTRIDTPAGPLPVEALRRGDVVWTVDAAGSRVAAPLIAVARVPVPPGHVLVHLVLEDGREILASPGHPAADGRSLGALQPGDLLDGARVVRAEGRPYDQAATYDVLPAGATGLYWANGVLVASTLDGARIADRR